MRQRTSLKELLYPQLRRSEKPVIIPNGLECSYCGNEIKANLKNVKNIKCPRCKQEYEIYNDTWKNKPTIQQY